MKCENCGNKLAARVKAWAKEDGNLEWRCDQCFNLTPFWFPDVYLGGPGGSPRTDPNLCNLKTGEEIPFSTKREKAAVMNYCQVRQADSAERQHGARNEEYLHRKKYFIGGR